MGILNVQCMAIFSWGNSNENRKHLRFQGLRQSHICRAKVIKNKTHLLRIPLIRLKRPTNSKGHHLYDTNLGQATRTSHFSKGSLPNQPSHSLLPLQEVPASDPNHAENPVGISWSSVNEISRILKWRYVSTIFWPYFVVIFPLNQGNAWISRPFTDPTSLLLYLSHQLFAVQTVRKLMKWFQTGHVGVQLGL